MRRSASSCCACRATACAASCRSLIPKSRWNRRPSASPSSFPCTRRIRKVVFRFLRATVASLDATGGGEPFDIFLLSDTRDDRLAARERALFAAWKQTDRRPGRLHYRRRAVNTGFKAGNLRDFCDRWGGDYACMIVLDADSIMSGAAMLRLAGLMQANPRLGILQTLIVGLPATSPFARIFQFGMRHGMRTYTAGSAWWQGDAGPYWGHNAIVRLAPFIEHCRLPPVPGRPPLGGDVLSHDQIEAVLMRRAGWGVRVLPIEGGSFEANPPTLLDFIKRDLRWCHGNMQYTRLLRLAGSHSLGKLQMLLAILMYASAPCWLAFCALGLLQLLSPALGLPSGVLFAEPAGLPGDGVLVALSLALFVAVVMGAWAPKLLGLLQALSDRVLRRKYGGASKLLGGAVVEFVFFHAARASGRRGADHLHRGIAAGPTARVGLAVPLASSRVARRRGAPAFATNRAWDHGGAVADVPSAGRAGMVRPFPCRAAARHPLRGGDSQPDSGQAAYRVRFVRNRGGAEADAGSASGLRKNVGRRFLGSERWPHRRSGGGRRGLLDTPG